MGKPPILIVPGVIPEFLKKLALVHVPPAIEPGLPQLGGQLFQGPQIFRLRSHQGFVVGAEGLDKGVVLRVFLRGKIPVNKEPLEIAVGGAAGV